VVTVALNAAHARLKEAQPMAAAIPAATIELRMSAIITT
jgi:hypothetical protein